MDLSFHAAVQTLGASGDDIDESTLRTWLVMEYSAIVERIVMASACDDLSLFVTIYNWS